MLHLFSEHKFQCILLDYNKRICECEKEIFLFYSIRLIFPQKVVSTEITFNQNVTKMVLLVFPGHKYLGPGNDMDSGEPVDSDDVIAQAHDRAYEEAVCQEDIYEADEKAIFLFILDWIKNKNWHSAVGAIGLSLKNCTERLLKRVLYPRFIRPSSENVI